MVVVILSDQLTRFGPSITHDADPTSPHGQFCLLSQWSVCWPLPPLPFDHQHIHQQMLLGVGHCAGGWGTVAMWPLP